MTSSPAWEAHLQRERLRKRALFQQAYDQRVRTRLSAKAQLLSSTSLPAVALASLEVAEA